MHKTCFFYGFLKPFDSNPDRLTASIFASTFYRQASNKGGIEDSSYSQTFKLISLPKLNLLVWLAIRMNMKTIEVVAAVIMDAEKVLCVQRGESKLDYISKKWEFPGGKIEAGENHEEALIREINEELELTIEVGHRVTTVDHIYPDFRLIMHAYTCHVTGKEQGKLTLTEHLDFQWMQLDDGAFRMLDWAGADIPIVDVLINSVRASRA